MGETAGVGVTVGWAGLDGTVTTTGLVGAVATEVETGRFVGMGLGTTALVIANATRGAGFVMVRGSTVELV